MAQIVEPAPARKAKMQKDPVLAAVPVIKHKPTTADLKELKRASEEAVEKLGIRRTSPDFKPAASAICSLSAKNRVQPSQVIETLAKNDASSIKSLKASFEYYQKNKSSLGPYEQDKLDKRPAMMDIMDSFYVERSNSGGQPSYYMPREDAGKQAILEKLGKINR